MCFYVCCNPIVIGIPIGDILGTKSVCGIINTTTKLRHDSTGGTWESSDTNVAKIDAAGNVRAIGFGVATIIYGYPVKPCGWHYYQAVDFNVYQLPTVAPITGASSVCVGSTIQLSNTTQNGVWSSVAGRATINNVGVVTGNSIGIATMRYVIANSNGCATISSKDIVVNPIPATPSIGYKAPFSNPQAGAPTGGFCVGKVFGVSGSPAQGLWRATGCISVTNPGGIATINTTGAGSLTYTFTDSKGCANSRTMTGTGFVCPTARGVINNGQLTIDNLQFTISPNPAHTTVSLQVEKLVGEGQINITDIHGKTVKQQPLSMGNNTIDIANLAKGMYFISTITSEGKTTKKLVVE